MTDFRKILPPADARTVVITPADLVSAIGSIEFCRLSREMDGRPCYRLMTNLRIVLGYDNYYERSIEIEVPAGIQTDFASVPRAFAWYAPPDGEDYRVAAVVHDYLYRYGVVPRWLADAIFRQLIAPRRKVRRWLMWAAVRVGGRSSYQGRIAY